MTSETEEGQRLSQGKLKRITQGMGKIKATRKYENPIEFPETHKLWMDTNSKPTIRAADDQATFNRLHPIPFTVTIPPEEIDNAMTLGCNHPIGPLALIDLVGLDVTLQILRSLHAETREPSSAPSPLLEHMVRAGYLGTKTAKGFRAR